MAGTSGREGAGLAGELAAAPARFTFFQAVRLLERLYPDRNPVGGFDAPDTEVAHFSAHPSLAFPVAEIETVALRDGEPARLSVNFMGLIGPLGVLPYHYTQLVADRVRARDRSLQAFLDIFQHRMISLFYRAWEKHYFLSAYERGADDPVTEHLHDLLGIGPAASRPRAPLHSEALLFYASALAPLPRSAVALEQMLSDFFLVPAAVEQFVGGWYRLGANAQCTLGSEDGASSQLGRGAVAGDEMWDQQARVRIRLGPLTRAQYEQFLPTGEAHEVLRRVVRFFSQDQFDIEVQLVLKPDEVPSCRIAADGERPAALGWGTWLRTGAFARDADETVLTL